MRSWCTGYSRLMLALLIHDVACSEGMLDEEKQRLATAYNDTLKPY